MTREDADRYLALATDTPAQLRPSDVDRVMDAAAEDRRAAGLRSYLLGQERLLPGTRGALVRWTGA